MADDDIDWDAAQNGELGQQAQLRAITALQAEVMRPQQTPAPAQAQVGAGPYGLPSLPDLPASPDTRPSATSYDPPMDDRLRAALDNVAKSSGGYLPYDLGQRTLDMFAGTPPGRAFYGGRLAGQGGLQLARMVNEGEDTDVADPRALAAMGKLNAGADLILSGFGVPHPAGMLAYRFAQGPATGHFLADPSRMPMRTQRYEDIAAPIAKKIDTAQLDRAWDKAQAALPEWLQPIMYRQPRNRLPPQQ